MGGTDRSSPPDAAVTGAAVDHVLLSYLYLDEGNLDAYASLLADDVQLKRPGQPTRSGRAAVLAALAGTAGPPGQHRLYQVIASGDCVATVGRCTGPAALPHADGFHDVDFVDIVTVSAQGLLVGQRRFYDTSVS
jgi:ketosteroid isomerase-like protein